MRIYISIVFFVASTFAVLSQESAAYRVRKYVESGHTKAIKDVRGVRTSMDTPFKKLSLSVGVSSMGLGLEFVTPINEKLKMRAGLDYFPESIHLGNDLKVNDGNLINMIGGYIPDYDVNFKPNLFNGHFLVDYYPTPYNPFHLTAGFYVGASDIRARGHLVNPATGEPSTLVNPEDGWPDLIVEEYVLDIEGGRLDADIRMGGLIKPYVGIGFGHIIGNKRLGFNLDLGILYQGGYSIRQHGRKADKSENYKSSAIDINKYTKLVKVWPMLNFQMTYRLY